VQQNAGEVHGPELQKRVGPSTSRSASSGLAILAIFASVLATLVVRHVCDHEERVLADAIVAPPRSLTLFGPSA